MKKKSISFIIISFIIISFAFLCCGGSPSPQYRQPDNYYVYKIPNRRVAVSEFKHKGHVYLYIIGSKQHGANVIHSQSCPCINK